MPLHPDQNDRPPLHRPQLKRRDVLRGGAFIAAGVGAAPLLAACGGDSGAGAGATDYPLATPDSPVKLPIFDDNQPIADGQDIEDVAVLKVLNYADYIAPKVKKNFSEEYGLTIEVTPYNNYDEMISKLTQPGAAFDVVFPGPTVLSQMVYGQLLQPFNQTYIPNLKNVWPEYQDPWYDQGAQYTVPYTVYTSGIGYRADRVQDTSAGYQMLWDPAYADKVGVIDDAFEALSMSMLAWDISQDINTGDPEIINAAKDKLLELAQYNVQIDITQYETIPTGKFTVHQAWSGDLIAGRWYLPSGETPEVLGYWVPESSSERVISNDCIAIPKSSPSPVLAHTFVNYMIDNDVSLTNFTWNGYQPPLTKLDSKYLIDQGLIPENLLSAVVVPEDFEVGLQQYEMPLETQNLWLGAFQEFQSGA